MVACDDENVRREEGKVKEGGTKRDILTLKDLTKVYDRSSCRGKMRVAVNRLNLSMKPSEVCVLGKWCVCMFVRVYVHVCARWCSLLIKESSLNSCSHVHVHSLDTALFFASLTMAQDGAGKNNCVIPHT